MGRDWYWRRAAAKPKPSSTTTNTISAQKTTLSGCIGLVFHMFGSHRFHCPSNHQTSSCSNSRTSSSSSSSSKPPGIAGTEAPRNILELQEEEAASTSATLTSTTKQEEFLDIPPMMGIQIKTSSGDIMSKVGDPNNETPRTNTPTLVARLMGLDLLPTETQSPSFQTPKALLRSKISGRTSSLDGDMRGGTRSLPETPRTSSARRSDVDHHHRLSLQIYKENMELVMSRLSSLKIKDLKHECEMVKEVKQSVCRKVGMNITNTFQNRGELVSRIVKHSTHSGSKSSTNYQNPQRPKSSSPRIRKQSSHKLHVFEEEQDEQHKKQQRAASKCKKGSNKKLDSRKPRVQALEINRNKKEEPFVRLSTPSRVNNPDKKWRKTPLSNDLLNTKIPSLVPLKKYPSPTSTKIPQKQVLDAQRPKTLSSSTNVRWCNYVTTTSTISTACDEAEYEYIARILRRTGLNKDTQVSISSWLSPSHPLDPSIFHHLEHYTTCSTNDNKTKCSELRHRSNRKLLFHLVDELLAEILKPCFNMKPWVICISMGHGLSSMDGSQLIDNLCSKIRSFPRSDCRVLEDIDALIGRDLPDIKLQSVTAYEEEGEGIVSEIERYILETLIHEMADSISLRFV